MIAKVQLWGRTIGAVSLEEGREVAAFQYDPDFARSGNVVARNQDDHVKNIAFLMNPQGEWSLAPAFDVTYSYNPSGSWTSTHQMTLNGKRDGFSLEDFEACARSAGMKRGRGATILEEVQAAVKRWPQFAAEAQLTEGWRDQIQKSHRLLFPKT